MIIISDIVNALIEDYVNYLISEGITTQSRAFQKSNLMIQAIKSNLGGLITHRRSPYKDLGGNENCLLYVYKDPKSKTQWGFAYKLFNDENVIVYYMRNLKLVKESKKPDEEN